MPEYLSPGVYIEETEIGSKPVEGVSTSTAGFLGEAERGPTTPKLITSWLDYQRVYGGLAGEGSYLPYAVEGFFNNGGQRCYIGRIVQAGATGAEIGLKKGSAGALTVQAVGEGEWGNRVAVKVAKGTLSGFRLNVYYWKDAVPLSDPEIAAKDAPRPSVSETFDNLSVDAKSPDYYEKRINGVSQLIRVAKKAGDSGEQPDEAKIAYLAGGLDSSENAGQVSAVPAANQIKLSDGASADKNAYVGMTIHILDGDAKGQSRTVTEYAATKIATLNAAWAEGKAPAAGAKYRITRSGVTVGDYKRTDSAAGSRKGLAGFEEIDEISIVYAPNPDAVSGLTEELIAHCEKLKDRFAIVDAAQNSDAGTLDPRSNDTKYAAFYYPWIKVTEPASGLLRTVPPGGHVAGIFARTDAERGVHKAPANEVVRGAIDLEFQITKGEQDILNPRGVNVIRAFPGRGIRVWGARTLSSDPAWKYVNVRRLFNFLEESIDEGTQWVVFEPNDEKLWGRVRRTVTEFLTRVWRDGALMGTKPEEAFFVKCDRTTMTQNDIDNGRLIVLVGVAPVKPAEFVVFRIAQTSGGANG
ncbi:phage tail sheath family protein [Paenibacillus thailandensis]|uniref:Phage tail sheath family protein n=1 Tax=Paenibacillus thailandensis TaxID=393250 RepID=A0ABW5QXW0_9BACL